MTSGFIDIAIGTLLARVRNRTNTPTVSVKMVGTLWDLLVLSMLVRFADRTAINNFERDEGSTRREKTAFG